MKIVVERTGGFTGIKRRFEAEAEESQIARLQQWDAADAEYPDRFHYRITVETGNEMRSFSVTEKALLEIIGKLS
jgi:hypothetical protein